MATRVFISWSGELSRKLGEALRDWLPASLQFVKPYFSPQDIEKGSKWDSEISKELEASDVGIVCLTQDNTEKPWIVFEAGALSKSVDKSRVCTLLFNLESSDVKGPLTSFQATRFNKSDFKKLFETINAAGGESRLDAAVLDSVFTMWWPKLDAAVSEIIESHKDADQSARRSDRDILEEVLDLARLSASRDRSDRLGAGALADLVAALEGLVLFLGGEVDPAVASEALERLTEPVEFLCRRAGNPAAFRRWRQLRERLAGEGRLDLLLDEPAMRVAHRAPEEN